MCSALNLYVVVGSLFEFWRETRDRQQNWDREMVSIGSSPCRGLLTLCQLVNFLLLPVCQKNGDGI